MLGAEPVLRLADKFNRLSDWRAVCRGRLLELLYPPACIACGAEIEAGGPASFCDACSQRLAVFEPPFCPACGASVPVALPAGKTCGHCGDSRPRFDRATSLAPYEGLLRELLLRAKKPEGEVTALALAHRLLAERGDWLRGIEIDVVCAVPMHWSRRLRRLCNSPATMASVVARELKLPLAAELVCRRRATQQQYSLPPTRRAANVRRAFEVRAGYELKSAHVLLVDDILTTGATCNEVARALKRSGASEVSVAVVGRSCSGR
jgi:predicted amidophosphoribosyltransferase